MLITEPDEFESKRPSDSGKLEMASSAYTGGIGHSDAYGGRWPSCKLPNYYGPYQRFMLESAKFELLKTISMKNGLGWNRLKTKCGISSDDSRDSSFKGWGDASDNFSFSALPPDYLYEFTDNVAANSSARDTAAYSSVRNTKTSKTVAAATATNDDSNGGDGSVKKIENDASTSGYDNGKLGTNDTDVAEPSTSASSDSTSHEKTDLALTSKNEEENVKVDNSSDKITLNTSVITVEDDTDNEPIIIDDSFSVSNDLNSSKSDLIIVDHDSSSDSLEILEQTLKRKLQELEADDIEDGEIIDLNDDDDDDDIVIEEQEKSKKSESLNVTIEINSDERKQKKQKSSSSASSSSSSSAGDGSCLENNSPQPEINITPFFVLDRKPYDLDKILSENSDVKNDGVKELIDTDELLDEPETIESSVDDALTGCKDVASSQSVPTSAVGNDTLDKKYKCDLCPAISANKDKMLAHLQQAMHFSASLVAMNANGKPESLVKEDGLKNKKALYKSIIPICPEPSCSNIFKDIYSCARHFQSTHNRDKEGLVYALAELQGEEVIKRQHLILECAICAKNFPSSKSLFKHMKNENHVTFTTQKDTQTSFLCCKCGHTYSSLWKGLEHRRRKKPHFADFRVLHIGLQRIKKTVLPMIKTPLVELTPAESELNKLTELLKNSKGAERKQIKHQIYNLRKILRRSAS